MDSSGKKSRRGLASGVLQGPRRKGWPNSNWKGLYPMGLWGAALSLRTAIRSKDIKSSFSCRENFVI